ncbi:MAG: PKD domain-containing protein [Thermoplasmata archaeon]|nr:PKD domain-containing protein [Thermoplasmata archaeon]
MRREWSHLARGNVVPLLGTVLLVTVLLGANASAIPSRPTGIPGAGTAVRAALGVAPPGWVTLPVSGSLPPTRVAPAMAYDAVLNESILFGGHLVGQSNDYNDTWALRGETWTNLGASLPLSPPGRSGAKMVWDAADSEIVLFGGYNSSTGAFYNDTWIFAAGHWSQDVVAIAPPPRNWEAFGWDSQASSAVMYGGANSTSALNDTWLFVGGTWTRGNPATVPGPLAYAAAADDPADHGFVMFGGSPSPSSSSPVNTTWVYSSSNWLLVRGPAPGARTSGDIAWDPARSADLLAGGYNGSTSTYDGDTWELNASGWSQLVPSIAFPARGASGGAYDAASARVEFFGGATAGSDLDTTQAFDELQARITDNASSGMSPLKVQFGSIETAGVPNYTYSWSFADGSFSSAAAPSHTFTTQGTYDVRVNVTDAGGIVAGANTTVRASAALLSASVSATPATGTAPLRVTLHDSVAGGAAPYNVTWSFGDGSTGYGVWANHTFVSSGTYVVNATARDSASGLKVSSTTVTVSAAAVPFTASISLSPVSGFAPLNVSLRASTSGGVGADVATWAFGDGATGTGLAATHLYSAAGNYTVALTVRDSAGHTAYANQTIEVHASTPVTECVGSGCLSPLDSLGIIVGIAILAGAVIVLAWRRRSPRDGPPTPPSAQPADHAPAHFGPGAVPGPAGLPASLAGAEIASEPLAGSAGSPDTAESDAAGATLSNQILVHLLRQGRSDPGAPNLPGLTQDGIAGGLGRPQASFVRSLQRLEKSGYVVSRTDHVSGRARRVKVYELTPRGESAARRLFGEFAGR